MSYKFSIKPKNVTFKKTKHVFINSQIPCEIDSEIMQSCIKTEPDSMNNQLPAVWSKAIDYQVMDSVDNKWIDFTSCIFVSNVGHANPAIVQAINATVNKGLLNAYYYPTAERASFTSNLLKAVGQTYDKVLLLSTGSEANEAAIKMAIIYGTKQSRSKRKIISFENSFHGKTMGSQMAGGKLKEKSWIGFQHPDLINIPFPYPWVLEKQNKTGEQFFEDTIKELNETHGIAKENIAGFISEPYQGWCAVFLPKDYAQAMQKFCNENNSLLIIDEVQSGFGRTGKLFAYEHFDITPDIIICGKAISSSLPLSAVITKNYIIGDNQSFNSTHGGNPVAVAASDASLAYLINYNLVGDSERKGNILEYILNKWQKECPEYIDKVFCKGLLASVFIKSNTEESNEDFVDRLIEKAFYKGLMSVRTGSGTLKIGPPLTIPEDALEEGVEILKESLSELINEQESRQIKIKAQRHVGINTSDIEKSLFFYTKILDFEVISDCVDASQYINTLSGISGNTLRMAKLKSKGAAVVIELVEYQTNIQERSALKINTDGVGHLAVQVENINQAWQILHDAGHEPISKPLLSDDGYARVFFCYDPNGFRIEFVELV